MSEPDAKGRTKGEMTRDAIRQAIVRIEQGRPRVIKKGRKLSIAAVAEEVGCDRAVIRRYHPDLAERIRGAVGKGVRTQRDQKHLELKELRAKLRELKEDYAEVQELNRNMAVEMASLVHENQRLKAIVDNEKVVAFPSKKR